MVVDSDPKPDRSRPRGSGDLTVIEEEFAQLLGRLVARRWLSEQRRVGLAATTAPGPEPPDGPGASQTRDASGGKPPLP
jgi:hypothetical protein